MNKANKLRFAYSEKVPESEVIYIIALITLIFESMVKGECSQFNFRKLNRFVLTHKKLAALLNDPSVAKSSQQAANYINDSVINPETLEVGKLDIVSRWAISSWIVEFENDLIHTPYGAFQKAWDFTLDTEKAGIANGIYKSEEELIKIDKAAGRYTEPPKISLTTNAHSCLIAARGQWLSAKNLADLLEVGVNRIGLLLNDLVKSNTIQTEKRPVPVVHPNGKRETRNQTFYRIEVTA